MAVSTFTKTKSIAEEKLQVQDLSPEKFRLEIQYYITKIILILWNSYRSFFQAFKQNVKSEIESAKQDFKNNNKK